MTPEHELEEDLYDVADPAEAAFLMVHIPELFRTYRRTLTGKYAYAFADPVRVKTFLSQFFAGSVYQRYAAEIKRFTSARYMSDKLEREER